MSFLGMLVGRLLRFVFSRRFLYLFILTKEERSLPNFLRVLSHYLVLILIILPLIIFQKEEFISTFTNFHQRRMVYEWDNILLTWLSIPFIVWLLYYVAGVLEAKDPQRSSIKKSVLHKLKEQSDQTVDSSEVRTIILHEDDYHPFKRGKVGKVPKIIRVETASKEEWEAYQEEHPYRNYHSPYAVIKVEYIEESVLKQMVRQVKETGLKKGNP